jgi:hypothetical protein
LIVDLEHVDDRGPPTLIASGSRDDRVTATEAVLPHDMRCDVRVAGLGEIAVRCAADEPSITRRIEPPLRLTIRDDGSRWLMLLMVALPPAPAIPAVPTPIAVELLLLRATAIIATRVAVIAMVAVLTVIAVLRPLRLFGWSGRTGLTRFPRLCGRLGGRRRWSR